VTKTEWKLEEGCVLSIGVFVWERSDCRTTCQPCCKRDVRSRTRVVTAKTAQASCSQARIFITDKQRRKLKNSADALEQSVNHANICLEIHC
jgi:hypothetical protein